MRGQDDRPDAPGARARGRDDRPDQPWSGGRGQDDRPDAPGEALWAVRTTVLTGPVVGQDERPDDPGIIAGRSGRSS